MYSWNQSTNKNLISATTLYISLDCIYIAKMIHGPYNVMWLRVFTLTRSSLSLVWGSLQRDPDGSCVMTGDGGSACTSGLTVRGNLSVGIILMPVHCLGQNNPPAQLYCYNPLKAVFAVCTLPPPQVQHSKTACLAPTVILVWGNFFSMIFRCL